MGEGKRQSRARLEAAWARLAERDDPAIFTQLYPQAARQAADAADARAAAGQSLGPLDGRIVTIKDFFDVAGEATTAGSSMLRGAPPAEADAPVVGRLRAAGAVILGKTNMTEFAFSGLGLNPHWGTPGNARDRARLPGGSSSGAGVAAALGIGEIAIGTDTGGSVRIPAALNGVAGFKPSARRVPREGAFPLSYTLDSIGPLAPSVTLCALADSVMAGEPPAELEPASLAGRTVAVVEDFLDGTEPEVAAAFEASLGRLQAAGVRITAAATGDLGRRDAVDPGRGADRPGRSRRNPRRPSGTASRGIRPPGARPHPPGARGIRPALPCLPQAPRGADRGPGRADGGGPDPRHADDAAGRPHHRRGHG